MEPEDQIIEVQTDAEAFVYFEKGADQSGIETR